MRDARPRESWQRLTAAGATVISTPQAWSIAESSVTIRSYSAFGPAGEQIFLTQSDSPTRPIYHGPHTAIGQIVLVTADLGPVTEFYRTLFSVEPIASFVCDSPEVSRILGADVRFTVTLLGDVTGFCGIEIQQHERAGTTYPTSLDRRGLAMATFRVSDLAACRHRCQSSGIPVDGARENGGFRVRGAVGELIEIVG